VWPTVSRPNDITAPCLSIPVLFFIARAPYRTSFTHTTSATMRGGWRQSGKDHTWDQRPARGSRGRGPRYGYPSRSAHGRTLISTAPAPPLGELIQSISKDDLAKDSKLYLDSAKIQDCSLVASYSWLEGGEPTILVPGKFTFLLSKRRKPDSRKANHLAGHHPKAKPNSQKTRAITSATPTQPPFPRT
jgi:hypothetical protein